MTYKVYIHIVLYIAYTYTIYIGYNRNQRHLARHISMREGGCSEGVQWILGEVFMQTFDFNITASWLWLNSNVNVGVSLRVCCVLLEHLYVMRDSPSCGSFYCMIILKAICLLL